MALPRNAYRQVKTIRAGIYADEHGINRAMLFLAARPREGRYARKRPKSAMRPADARGGEHNLQYVKANEVRRTQTRRYVSAWGLHIVNYAAPGSPPAVGAVMVDQRETIRRVLSREREEARPCI